MNELIVIAPYWLADEQVWVFDDERVGLVQEPFVSGIPEMIERLVENIDNAQSGFRLIFSRSPFPQYQNKLEWLAEEYGGNWYRSAEYGMEGWLCPALFHYFDEAPRELYVKAEPLKR